MFKWFKGARPLRMVDPRFGDLRYQRDAQFWEGRAEFAPLRAPVEVLIDGPDTGPTEGQRAFLDELERRYDAMWPDVRERLAHAAQRVHADSSTLVLVAISIPRGGVDRAGEEWNLSYETRPSSWHCTVHMIGWTPQDVTAEC